eukprot:CAMPEP_0174244180 /NCGR_PEP_ID=MMETSP0417-20130205/34362_1 /TAXON_ID=242541 /ORGANISM="Mayorella sp, Strain BSH-02190019" /LENGTH=601 /DNA_ID=CAMNT_0015323817 /DNA_START=35 /DNA_END=1837 /DNA_ORIENTATION=+
MASTASTSSAHPADDQLLKRFLGLSSSLTGSFAENVLDVAVIQKMVHEIEQDINLAKIEDVPAERSQLLTSVHDKLDVIQDFFATEFLALKKCLIAPTRDMTTITTHLNDLSLFVDANEVGFYGILDVFDRSFSRSSLGFDLQARVDDVFEHFRKDLAHVANAIRALKAGTSTSEVFHHDVLSPTISRLSKPPEEAELNFKIRSGDSIQTTLAEYERYLKDRTFSHFGYPYNLEFHYKDLSRFMRYSINNLGDPFVESNYGVHSRQFEVEVLEFFADLWKIPLDSYWGYMTTCGTEGNLQGILLGREVLPPNAVLYSSREAHYSIFKAARFYCIESECIDTLWNGEIDYDHLEARLTAHADRPALINCNVGTTVKGAVDNLDRILEILTRTGYTEDRFYIHCDGALFALIIPFLKEALDVNFTKPIGSMSVSGHKFMGCPMPSGVCITRKEHIKKLEQHIDYLNSKDTTIMGSRNGQSALFLWHTIRSKGADGLASDARTCLDRAQLLYDLLRNEGIYCMLNAFSNTVVLERPPEEVFVKRWQLACEKDIAHVVVMPNVTKEKIYTFVKELVKCRNEVGVAPRVGVETYWPLDGSECTSTR